MCQAHMAGGEVMDDRVMGYPVGRNVTAKGMNADLEVDPLRLSAFAVCNEELARLIVKWN